GASRVVVRGGGVSVSIFTGWEVVVAICPPTGLTTTEVLATCGPGMISGTVFEAYGPLNGVVTPVGEVGAGFEKASVRGPPETTCPGTPSTFWSISLPGVLCVISLPAESVRVSDQPVSTPRCPLSFSTSSVHCPLTGVPLAMNAASPRPPKRAESGRTRAVSGMSTASMNWNALLSNVVSRNSVEGGNGNNGWGLAVSRTRVASGPIRLSFRSLVNMLLPSASLSPLMLPVTGRWPGVVPRGPRETLGGEVVMLGLPVPPWAGGMLSGVWVASQDGSAAWTPSVSPFELPGAAPAAGPT